MGLIAWLAGKPDATAARPGSREAAWEAAFRANTLPSFVADRLGAMRAGNAAWMSTGGTAELLLMRRHGLQPVATVSGTCWFRTGWQPGAPMGAAGYSDNWGQPRMEGWRRALARLRAEAVACGAHIVADTRLRGATGDGKDRDYTMLGTAFRLNGVDASPKPIVTTLSALATLQLLRADIVPGGIAVAAASGCLWPPAGKKVVSAGRTTYEGWGTFQRRALPELTEIDAKTRKMALERLAQTAATEGNHVLTHAITGEMELIERENAPPGYFVRYTAIGTIIDTAVLGTALARNVTLHTGLLMNDGTHAARAEENSAL
jgi:uncharacterized protein YbjQ (UPF0145 family)